MTAAPIPHISYPDLPVSARRDEIAAAIRDHQVVIVAGETGSGKTTQLPKICLELGRTSIAHTQPRRIAARTIAERIAEELDVELGTLVGYQVRFTDESSAQTRIKLMTDGILLAQLSHDRMLERYDTIIIDEAHERSLNIDFILGYLKRLLPKRPDLKVIVTSATIDPESFANHFADAAGEPAPIIEVSGRTYPVEIRYRPLRADELAAELEDAAETDLDDEYDLAELEALTAPDPAPAPEPDPAPAADPEPAAAAAVQLPAPPNTEGMTLSERARAMAKYRRERTEAEKAMFAAERAAHLAELRGEKPPASSAGSAAAPSAAPSAAAPAAAAASEPAAAKQPTATKRSSKPLPAEAPREDRDVNEAIIAALRELEAESPGDVLVFLPGEREIRDAEEAIQGAYSSGRNDTEVLPLYGRLSARDQHRVFETKRAPGIRRRVVLATNVAETSLTVPGIAYVIDTGTARISRYSTRAKVQRLPTEPVSQASANQRSGRSGRTRPGVCIRLYSREDFQSRPEYTDPEILRTNLASVLLQMLGLRLGAIEDFPFLTPPDPRAVRDGTELLRELGALRARPDRRGLPQLTKVGRELARLPIEPRYARMVLAARDAGVAREVMIIVAGLTVQDLRERPLEQRQRADELHSRFRDPSSDFLSLLKLWDYLFELRDELSSSALKRRMKDEFLNFVRWREWQDLVRQLREIARPLGIEVQLRREGNAADPDRVHQALLAGLLSHIGVRDELKRDYRGARSTRFRIFPGSGLAKSQPDAVMAAELVETSQLFARTVAKIDPAWAEELGGPLVKKQLADPHWERKQGQAVALESVTLYGVPLVRGRRVSLATSDPVHAHELFIEHALVRGDWTGRYPFERRNKQLLAELEQLEHRTRQYGLVSEQQLIDFFAERVPERVVSQASFDRWWRQVRQEHPNLLTLRKNDLIDAEVETDREDDFPREWKQGDQRLKLGYRFDPASGDDGVTATVPLALLARLRDEGFDWGVPGMRAELITALLRSLPKATRRNFVPANDWAQRMLATIGEVRPDRDEPVPGTLVEVLHEHLQRAGGIRFSVSEFDLDRVPEHLQLRFRVLNEHGRELATGHDLTALQQRLKRESEKALASITATAAAMHDAKRATEPVTPAAIGNTAPVTEQQGLTEWPATPIPEHFDLGRKHGVVRAYPTLRLADPEHPAASRIDLALATTPQDQAREHPLAVAALLARSVPSPASYVQAHLTSAEKLSLAASPYRSVDALLDDTLFALAYAALPESPVRSVESFAKLRETFNAGLVDSMFAAAKLVAEVLQAHREATLAVKNTNALAHLASLQDVREQLAALVFDGFVSRTGMQQLRHLPRYLRAATHRVERLGTSAAIERVGMTEYLQAAELYRQAGGALPAPLTASPGLLRVRWLLEELRVSLFAQQLGTAETVSLKRIRKALAEVEQ
ncbi:ATP-dependent RNA helicase HrpA [Gulosibacter hominis]|uniref:ATP-dependent RNA helicase HrpA n=1 Tax=Gulosibacter hominis TaxID=2770504 RepID=UPI001E36EC3C|nr:ATP-dependent RNA helicase HrpA [Gulosibacter hominis]